jgi:uncharacterized protein (DUF885 family)
MPVSAIFAFAEHHVDEQAALDPFLATACGIPGYDHVLTDYSPDGYAQRAEHTRRALANLNTLPVTNDDDDRLAKGFISERFEIALATHDAGEWRRELRSAFGPAAGLRVIFDMMSRDGEAAWSNIAARLHAVPTALDRLQSTYEVGRAEGATAARRQALAAAEQCATWANTRWFDSLAAEAAERSDVSPALQAQLVDGAARSNAAYASFAAYLRDEYAPHADPADGCGAERYRLGVRAMLGADLNPQEMYDWAWDDFYHLRAEIAATCRQIKPGAPFAEVIELLDTDPGRAAHGIDAYLGWLQGLTDEALARSKDHFDIPDAIDRCEVLIAPEGSSAAPYYMDPSEDFGRPGRTFYPALGRDMFPKWGDVTTCYHESVPGHHLQIATAALHTASLSRIQRNDFISGHAEGWALYAEQLADEFGWFGSPDYRLGYLSGQMLRTVRVIVDTGMHLSLRIPADTTLNDGTPFHVGEPWNADLAFQFALSETGSTETFIRSEIDRYLGWPAQAIGYKIGQREWLAARDDARARDGASFDLKAWHTRALRLGPVGLNQLRAELSA